MLTALTIAGVVYASPGSDSRLDQFNKVFQILSSWFSCGLWVPPGVKSVFLKTITSQTSVTNKGISYTMSIKAIKFTLEHPC